MAFSGETRSSPRQFVSPAQDRLVGGRIVKAVDGDKQMLASMNSFARRPGVSSQATTARCSSPVPAVSSRITPARSQSPVRTFRHQPQSTLKRSSLSAAQEVVVEVPVNVTERVIRKVEIPEVVTLEKIVEVPHVQYKEIVKEVPKVVVKEVVREVRVPTTIEVVRHVPVIEVQTIEKLVEVPQVQILETIIEVPHIHIREKIVGGPAPVHVESASLTVVSPAVERVARRQFPSAGGSAIETIAPLTTADTSTSIYFGGVRPSPTTMGYNIDASRNFQR